MQMFKGIAEELCRAAKKIEKDNLLMAAPVYLFFAKENSMEYADVSLEQLLSLLEGQNLLSWQTARWMELSLEYGFGEIDTQERLGFFDQLGRFKTSLQQWMSYLNTEHQVGQGIVLIHIHCFSTSDSKKELSLEMVWWRQFFRQMHRYKRDFLFLVQTEEKDFAAIWELFDKECFCCEAEIRQPETSDYVEYFQHNLERIGLYMNQQSEKVLTELLEQYKECINSRILDKWQKEVVWEFLMKKQDQGNENKAVPADCFKEESLKKHLFKYQKDLTMIGFGVRNME